MAPNKTSVGLVDPNRLRPIQELHIWSPDCTVAADDYLVLDGELLLIADPVYLGVSPPSSPNPSAKYIRTHGIHITGFGGKTSCPVYWVDPFLLLPLSIFPEEELALPAETEILAERVSCSSGSLLFLPMRQDIPAALEENVRNILTNEEATRIRLPAGAYRIFFEQLKAPDDRCDELYRNVVIQKQ